MTKQEYIEISVELKHSEIPIQHQKKLQQLLNKEMHTDKEIETIRKDKNTGGDNNQCQNKMTK